MHQTTTTKAANTSLQVHTLDTTATANTTTLNNNPSSSTLVIITTQATALRQAGVRQWRCLRRQCQTCPNRLPESGWLRLHLQQQQQLRLSLRPRAGALIGGRNATGAERGTDPGIGKGRGAVPERGTGPGIETGPGRGSWRGPEKGAGRGSAENGHIPERRTGAGRRWEKSQERSPRRGWRTKEMAKVCNRWIIRNIL